MPTRHAIVAGYFYPAEPERLRADIAAYRQAASAPELSAGREPASDPSSRWSWDRPLLTMLPHAGHMFCGAVVAAALAGVCLPRRLVILAPSHTGLGHDLGFWPEGDWESPVGAVPVDADLGRELMALNPAFVPDTRPHAREHDIEVLLPFLRDTRPDLRILPIVAGRPGDLAGAAHALAALVSAHADDTALIVSSDMNHYASDEENRRLDALALEAFLSLDAWRLGAVVREKRISMCGIVPAMIGLLACAELGAAHARVAAYDTSARVSGDASRVVGYAGVRVW
ncbi:MAG: AmmeMemoRadiSam system protein B [Desulfovibrionaceae bacterium]|nr:AmmeMemoRadiSam system protein B [Desulfovibrionaceae bacterium]